MKNLLITGDSLSYNRYGYESEPCPNSTDCHIGMNSWSFRICREFIISAKGFKYGDELCFKETTVKGMGEGVDIINAAFGERVVTVMPEDGFVHFTAESDTGIIMLYIQCRKTNYCRFSITVDGVLQEKSVETYGEDGFFKGYGINALKLDCDKQKKTHEIVFSDFEYADTEPRVTIAGISNELRFAYTSGQGSRTSRFLLYHFEERIAKYNPDILFLTVGANDVTAHSEEEYGGYIRELFKKIRERFPNCKIFTLGIPLLAKVSDDVRGIKIDSDDELNRLAEKYNATLQASSKEFGAVCIDTKEIFEGISPEIWRFDNIHFSDKGNDMLFEKVCDILNKNIQIS